MKRNDWQHTALIFVAATVGVRAPGEPMPRRTLPEPSNVPFSYPKAPSGTCSHPHFLSRLASSSSQATSQPSGGLSASARSSS